MHLDTPETLGMHPETLETLSAADHLVAQLQPAQGGSLRQHAFSGWLPPLKRCIGRTIVHATPPLGIIAWRAQWRAQ